MSIEKNSLISLSQNKNFNMEIFLEYLKYQVDNRNEYSTIMTVEEYAVIMQILDPDMDLFSIEGQNWYSEWNGFKDRYSIPDCLSFLRYCNVRDLDPYNKLTDNLSRQRKKEEI